LTTIIKQTFASDGITGFYRGCAPVVIGNAVKAGTRFYTFESIRNLLKGDEGKLSPGRNILGEYSGWEGFG
jgi:solute carrier family 25 citrate transporter 1